MPAKTPLATCFVRSTYVIRTLISLGQPSVKVQGNHDSVPKGPELVRHFMLTGKLSNIS